MNTDITRTGQNSEVLNFYSAWETQKTLKSGIYCLRAIMKHGSHQEAKKILDELLKSEDFSIAQYIVEQDHNDEFESLLMHLRQRKWESDPKRNFDLGVSIMESLITDDNDKEAAKSMFIHLLKLQDDPQLLLNKLSQSPHLKKLQVFAELTVVVEKKMVGVLEEKGDLEKKVEELEAKSSEAEKRLKLIQETKEKVWEIASNYKIKDNKVYWGDKLMNVDLESFDVVSPEYGVAKDKNNVYLGPRTVPSVKTENFKQVEGSQYFMNDMNLYCVTTNHEISLLHNQEGGDLMDRIHSYQMEWLELVSDATFYPNFSRDGGVLVRDGEFKIVGWGGVIDEEWMKLEELNDANDTRKVKAKKLLISLGILDKKESINSELGGGYQVVGKKILFNNKPLLTYGIDYRDPIKKLSDSSNGAKFIGVCKSDSDSVSIAVNNMYVIVSGNIVEKNINISPIGLEILGEESLFLKNNDFIYMVGLRSELNKLVTVQKGTEIHVISDDLILLIKGVKCRAFYYSGGIQKIEFDLNKEYRKPTYADEEYEILKRFLLDKGLMAKELLEGNDDNEKQEEKVESEKRNDEIEIGGGYSIKKGKVFFEETVLLRHADPKTFKFICDIGSESIGKDKNAVYVNYKVATGNILSEGFEYLGTTSSDRFFKDSKFFYILGYRNRFQNIGEVHDSKLYIDDRDTGAIVKNNKYRIILNSSLKLDNGNLLEDIWFPLNKEHKVGSAYCKVVSIRKMLVALGLMSSKFL